MKLAVCQLVILLVCFAQAGLYQEHKQIGDTAFQDAEIQVLLKSTGFATLFDSSGNFSSELEFTNTISYGDIVALAGDYEVDPVRMIQELKNRGMLSQTITLQQEYASQGQLDAPNAELMDAHEHYIALALANDAHFYRYGDDFDDHIKQISFEYIDKVLTQFHSLGDKLSKIADDNAISKYVTLQSIAMGLAYKASKESDAKAKKSLMIAAVVYNASANHYLQDSFAAGHRVVDRSSAGNILFTDRVHHNYFNKLGLPAINLKGDVWYTYGDSYYLTHKPTSFKETLKDSENFNKAKVANVLSIKNMLAAFQSTTDFKLVKVLKKERATEYTFDRPDVDYFNRSFYKQLFNYFPELTHFPIPLETDLDELIDGNPNASAFRISKEAFEMSGSEDIVPEIKRNYGMKFSAGISNAWYNRNNDFDYRGSSSSDPTLDFENVYNTRLRLELTYKGVGVGSLYTDKTPYWDIGLAAAAGIRDTEINYAFLFHTKWQSVRSIWSGIGLETGMVKSFYTTKVFAVAGIIKEFRWRRLSVTGGVYIKEIQRVPSNYNYMIKVMAMSLIL